MSLDAVSPARGGRWPPVGSSVRLGTMTKKLLSLMGCVALATAMMTAGCGKKDEAKPAAKAEPGAAAPDKTEPAAPDKAAAPASATPAADGKVAIDVGKKGYTPDRIEAAPGQDLTLVVTRTADTKCGEFFKVAGGEQVELPLNTPVEFPVKVPDDGEVRFTCGMDMMTGVIVANKQ